MARRLESTNKSAVVAPGATTVNVVEPPALKITWLDDQRTVDPAGPVKVT
jgi:hypothetical protein